MAAESVVCPRCGGDGRGWHQLLGGMAHILGACHLCLGTGRVSWVNQPQPISATEPAGRAGSGGG